MLHIQRVYLPPMSAPCPPMASPSSWCPSTRKASPKHSASLPINSSFSGSTQGFRWQRLMNKGPVGWSSLPGSSTLVANCCQRTLAPRLHVASRSSSPFLQARSRSLFRQRGSEAMSDSLKPARISRARLATYGIRSYVPCLRLKLCR